jgi:hypothetical protein
MEIMACNNFGLKLPHNQKIEGLEEDEEEEEEEAKEETRFQKFYKGNSFC